jgi:predicted transcriptional regulator
MANTGDEVQMRAALASVVARALRDIDRGAACRPKPHETEKLLAAADVVTLVRTGVDYDYRGAVIDAHAPEMPTRFAKQLVQVLRGACAVGLERCEALQLALRCARDSMPPLRLAILEDVVANPHSRTRDIRARVNKPYTTVDRQLQALHILGVLDCEEVEIPDRERSSWYYSVNERIDSTAIAYTRKVNTQTLET